jgi:serine/threonine protein kinase
MEKRFRTESEFHKQLSGCAHIVRLIETIENARAYYFLMEYCESDLGKIIKEQGIAVFTQEYSLRK